MKLITLCFIIFLLSSLVFADIIYVPADANTIQGGIDMAVDGDTVLVADSIYYENINFNGKKITVTSYFFMDQDTTHISNTIIDGSFPLNPDSGSVVYFVSGEDTNSVLCGFTLKGGAGTLIDFFYAIDRFGGGIFCLDSSPKILNSIITENREGGYIVGANSKPHLLNVSIIKNNTGFYHAYRAHGLYLFGSAPKLKNVDICYNITGGDGGGIHCVGSSPSFSNVSIHHNIASEYGGGIYFSGSTPFFDPVNRCNIYLNIASLGGNDVNTKDESNYQVIVDTFTVMQPSKMHANPLHQFSFDIQHGKIEQVASDLYIDPLEGDESNSGLKPEEPLKTVTMGLHKGIGTEDNPRILYLANGRYTPQTESYFPLFLRSHFSLKGKTRDGVIFDAEGSNSIFELINGKENISLNNMTLTGCERNGRATIMCYGSKFNMQNITVKNNQNKGGFIRNGSTAFLDSCLFYNNGDVALDIWLGSKAQVTNTNIEQNDGIGFRVHTKSDATLKNVIIQNNNSKGIYCHGNSAINAHNVSVLRNQEFDYFCDGAVSISGSSAILKNSIIASNKIDGRGGGIYIGNSTADLSSVLITNNEVSYKGGGMYIDDKSVVELSDVTVSYNKAIPPSAGSYTRGGGIYFYPSSEVIFDSVNRCNIYENKGPYGTDLCAEFYTGEITVIVDTFTVLEPTVSHAYPLKNFTFDILHDYNITNIDRNEFYPKEFSLSQNYPNPFNPSTTIDFTLPKSEFVKLKVYNILGKEMTTLVSAKLQEGNHTYTFEGNNLASGVYYYQLVVGEFSEVKKMVILK